MKKLVFTLTILLATNISSASTVNFNGSFQLLDSFGVSADVIDTNVTGWFDYDFTNGTGTGGEFYSGSDLLGSPWTATNVTMTLNTDGTVTSNMTFDWSGNLIDTIIVFEILATGNPYVSTMTTLDGDGDGIPGNAFTSGPKPGNSIVLNGTATVVPVPAAIWLFGSGLVGLFAFNRKVSI